MCRMPLLAGRITVGFQNLVNPVFHRAEFRLLPDRQFPVRWYGIGDRLAHHATVYTMLPGQPFDGFSGREAAPDLFK